MPEVNPPDDPGSPSQQGDKAKNPPPQLNAGDAAVAQAKIALADNTPYVWGGNGPPGPSGGFDCSGLIVWAYNTGAHIALPRTVAEMWNGGPLATVWDQPQQNAKAQLDPATPASVPLDTSLLIPGDLVIYLNVGDGGSAGHVKIYIGNNQTIEAPHTGANVTLNNLNTSENDDGHFRGVRRVSGEANVGSAGTSTGGGGGGDNSDPNANTVTIPPVQWYEQGVGDPRDNLPFSAFFLGQQIVGGPSNSASPVAGRGGSLTVQFQGGRGTSMPGVTLVRGGIGELTPTGYPPRKGGPFRCFFMMNPSTVSSTASIDTTGIASPFTTSASEKGSTVYPMQNQSYSFTIVFNRMYEVWQGNMVGPSQIGVRWDVRAVERLMGQYDATQNFSGTNNQGTLGEGNYGAGDNPPQALPIQVIFGGPNSIQFQGMIVSMDVTYTMFSSDMIPVECTVDIGVMRLYLPQMVGANLLNILDRGAFLQRGKPVTGLNPGHTFNPNPGTTGPDLTRIQDPNFVGPLPS